MWIQQEAIELCKLIEQIAPTYHCHIALTGGLLYKESPRKDCDLLIYRIRQKKSIDYVGLFNALSNIGITKKSGFGWCYKLIYNGKPIDLFDPDDKTNAKSGGSESHDDIIED